MPALIESSDVLVPGGTFLVETLVWLVGFALLVLWPLVETVVRQQWGYTLAVILGPIGGVLWFTVGRRTPAPARRAPHDFS